MSDREPDDRERLELLRKINTKIGWALLFLVLITLNTCGLADDIADELRGEDSPATAEAST